MIKQMQPGSEPLAPRPLETLKAGKRRQKQARPARPPHLALGRESIGVRTAKRDPGAPLLQLFSPAASSWKLQGCLTYLVYAEGKRQIWGKLPLLSCLTAFWCRDLESTQLCVFQKNLRM